MDTPSRSKFASLPYGTRVAHILFQFRVGSDANLFGRMVYGLFHVWGVEGLPPLPNPPKSLVQISRVPRGYGLDFGKSVYGYLFSRLRDRDKVEEVLSEFLTVKIMDKQHKLADKFKGMPLAEAEKVVMVAVKRYLVDTYRSENRREDSPDDKDISDVQHILETPGGGGDLGEVLPPAELDQVVREVQRLISPRNPEIARDIPLYFDHLMDGYKDSEIINNKMLPSLEAKPISQQAWSKGYKEVIKKVLDKHLERNASVSDTTLDRVANLVQATSKMALNENTLKTLNYDAQLTYLHSVFTGNVAEYLYNYARKLAGDLASSHPRFENVMGFINWDYGSPRQQGDTWSCRVWLKSGSFFTLEDGTEARGNLNVEIKFGDRVSLDLVLDNSKKIFSKTFSATQANPNTLGAYCAEAWVKALTGRDHY